MSSPPFFSAVDLGSNMTPLVPGFVVITATGYFNAGSNGAPPGHVQTTTPQVTEDISMVRGSHQIQFGGNFIRPIDNFVINLATFGNFNFNGGVTGNVLGDVLLGKLNTIQQANAGVAYDRQKYIGTYIQDTLAGHARRSEYQLRHRWEPYFATQTKYGYVSHF